MKSEVSREKKTSRGSGGRIYRSTQDGEATGLRLGAGHSHGREEGAGRKRKDRRAEAVGQVEDGHHHQKISCGCLET